MKSLLRRLGLAIPAIRRMHHELEELRGLNSELEQRIATFASLNESLITENHKLLRKRQVMNGPGERSNLACAYAILGSTGRAATHWIAAAFNCHDDVFFAHGPDLMPNKSCEEETVETFERIASQLSSFDFGDIDGYFDILERTGKYKVYGNIHGVMPRPGQFRRQYYTCAVLRHPVQRIQSLVSRWRYEIGISPVRASLYSVAEYSKTNEERLKQISTRYGISDFNQDAILFLHAVTETIHQDRYYFDLGIPLFQMERLVGDRDYFLNLFFQATNGLVRPDEEFLVGVGNLGPIDQRNQPLTARQVFRSWAPWQKRFFHDEIGSLALEDQYGMMGYNLSSVLCDA